MEEPTSSPSPENKSAPKKLARPHRCNDRVEDLIQVHLLNTVLLVYFPLCCIV